MQINLIHTPSNSVTLKIHVHFEVPISIFTRKAKNIGKEKMELRKENPNYHLYPESILELASIEQLLSVSLFSSDCLLINCKDKEYTSNSFINNKNFKGQLSWNKDDIYFTLMFWNVRINNAIFA